MRKNRKGKEWERATYALDKETKEMIKELAAFERMSQSELLSFLIKNFDAGINPSNKLNMLLEERTKLNKILTNIDYQIKEVSKQIKLFEEWKKQKQVKKVEAINILKNKILNKEFEDAERLSKVWQRMTGIPAIELLLESKREIEKEGV